MAVTYGWQPPGFGRIWVRWAVRACIRPGFPPSSSACAPYTHEPCSNSMLTQSSNYWSFQVVSPVTRLTLKSWACLSIIDVTGDHLSDRMVTLSLTPVRPFERQDCDSQLYSCETIWRQDGDSQLYSRVTSSLWSQPLSDRFLSEPHSSSAVALTHPSQGSPSSPPSPPTISWSGLCTVSLSLKTPELYHLPPLPLIHSTQWQGKRRRLPCPLRFLALSLDSWSHSWCCL